MLDGLVEERAHLAAARTALARMLDTARLRVATGAQVAGDRYTAESLGRMLRTHAKELAAEPAGPLFFGRLTFGPGEPRYHIGRRHIGDAGRPTVGRRLARAAGTGVLPGQRAGPDGRDDPPPLRLGRRGRADRLRGRAPRPRRGEPAAGRRDRAAPGRPDARHRRDHPARAGRARPRRTGRVGVRAGRARHRQDRGRPAPGRLPALLPPDAAVPWWGAGARAQPGVPGVHLLRAAGPG